MKFSTAAMKCTRDKSENLKKMLYLIDEAADHGADLLLLPEQALSGYLTSVVAMDSSPDLSKNEFLFQYKNAECVPKGDSVQAIIKKAIERKIYVCFGMTENDSELDGKLYNTAVLTGPDGYIGKYRKVHQPADEVHVYYGGTSFPVFDTPIGKIGMLICYDAWFPESGRELALGGADIILKPTATCYSNEDRDIKNDQGYYSYDLNEKATALHNGVFFISANQIGLCGESDYFGHSNIIAPTGRVLASTEDEEKIVYYEIGDLKEELYMNRGVAFAGLYYMKDRKPNFYNRIAAPSDRSNFA